ncbi:MAG: ribonuclease III [Actinomycetota bacterium]
MPCAIATRGTTLPGSDQKRGLAALGVPEQPGPIYDVALTHRSFAFENPDADGHNERLEFLGDAILGAVVTALIYESYPDLTEGEMARLRASVVNTEALADEARSLALGDHIRLGKGEEASGGRAKSSLLANAFEAIVGAVFVDQGMPAVEQRLRPLFEVKLRDSVASGRYDSKTALQEVAVRETGELPSYRIASSGPDHDKRFEAHVYLDGQLHGSGIGRSKKEAEQNAAREALDRLDGEPGSPTADARGDNDARAS